jgi:hypothetical protein
MKQRLDFRILAQPTETTCGPVCLNAVYHYFGDHLPLNDTIREVQYLKDGGTLAVFLGCHALQRGYSATIYTFDLRVFDPTWFGDGSALIHDSLQAQMAAKRDPKLHEATKGYLQFIELGGKLKFDDLTSSLIRKYLNHSVPIITGLSSTYLYRSKREFGTEDDFDDIRGEPAGHFVVLSGYNREERTVTIADPFLPNPYSESHQYKISIDRVLCSILLGVLTYDANLLIIEPKKRRTRSSSVNTDHR